MKKILSVFIALIITTTNYSAHALLNDNNQDNYLASEYSKSVEEKDYFRMASEDNKTVNIKDNELKKQILNYFIKYDGNDSPSDIRGEYSFKLIDNSYRKDPSSTELTTKDLEQLEAFTFQPYDNDFNPLEVKSLDGLEGAINLKMLSVSSGIIPEEGEEIRYSIGGISDLSPLSNLKNLEMLRLSHNAIQDINPLAKINSLKHLYISHNNLNDSSMSIVENLNNLISLDISLNAITDISNLNKLSNLKNLTMSACKLSKYESLYDLKNLELLGIDNTKISDISFVKNMPNLKYLTANNNGIKDLSPIENLTNLTTLSVIDNNISDFTPVGDVSRFEGEWGSTLSISSQIINSKTSIEFKEKEVVAETEVKGLEKFEGEKQVTASIDGIELLYDNDKLKITLNDELFEKLKKDGEITLDILYTFNIGEYYSDTIKLNGVVFKYQNSLENTPEKKPESNEDLSNPNTKGYMYYEPTVKKQRKIEKKEDKSEKDIINKEIEKKETPIPEQFGIKKLSKVANKIFIDIPSGQLGDEIKYLADLEVLKGTSDKNFEGDKAVNRAMIAAVLKRISINDNKVEVNFIDLKDDAWYKDEIKWAVANNILKGYEDNTIRGENNLSLGEFALIIDRYLQERNINLPQIREEVKIKDEFLPEWCRESIIRMIKIALIETEHEINYERIVSRYEMTHALYTILKYVGN